MQESPKLYSSVCACVISLWNKECKRIVNVFIKTENSAVKLLTTLLLRLSEPEH